jgi:hypothetical protein
VTLFDNDGGIQGFLNKWMIPGSTRKQCNKTFI